MLVQNWTKQGLIYPNRAQIPTVFQLPGNKIWRIYFSDRTPENKSFIKYLDVEAGNPKNILYEHKQSLLPFGKLGSFDYAGVMPSWIISNHLAGSANEIWMYYIGWTQREDIPFQNTIGLAISEDSGETFTKYSEGPILSNNSEDCYFSSTPCVIKTNGDMFRLFYLSCTEWREGNPPEPRYNIKYRYSSNGIDWGQGSSNEAVNYKNSDEGGICRSSVIVDPKNNLFKMWYCHRSINNYRTDRTKSYRIGYAENKNLAYPWQRKDELVNLPLSKNGWDSEAISYPYVLEHEGKYFMFYNGNGFGATGFGYATLEI